MSRMPAYAPQAIADRDDIEENEEDDASVGAAGHIGREDVDLVRLYLQHIGRRKLLKAHEEVILGERIERGLREVVSALVGIHSPGRIHEWNETNAAAVRLPP